MENRLIVAIDGPSGAGKSTIARLVAERLGFVYIDTGAMYRAVALWAQRASIPIDDAHRLEQLALAADIRFEPGSSRVLLNGEDVSQAIRTQEISGAASKVSAVGGVRRAMVAQQREMAGEASVVMEGRDIGTVVFPDAQVKVFLDADPNERARRRVDQSGGDPDQVAREMRDRDKHDRSRAESPLIQAPDAAYLDTTGLSPEEVVEAILKIVRARTSNGKGVTS